MSHGSERLADLIQFVKRTFVQTGYGDKDLLPYRGRGG
jgi:hypothetical protein